MFFLTISNNFSNQESVLTYDDSSLILEMIMHFMWAKGMQQATATEDFTVWKNKVLKRYIL